MSEARLREQFAALQPALEQWGKFVTQRVSDGVAHKLRQTGDSRSLKEFFKISPEPRVKTLGSFIAKALHRNKGYRDPMEQITDLVGVRFIVLLTSEMAIVGDVIQSTDGWDVREDRNHERERAMRPHFFDYESNHFIVKNSRPQVCGGVRIPLGLPCEIQVRTLLQHAYAELSHDRLYKPECNVPDGVRRLVARGSALLETTDNVFCQVSNEIAAALRVFQTAHAAALAAAQSAGIGMEDPQAQVTFKLLENFAGEAPAITVASLGDFLRLRDYVGRRMREHAADSVLFKQPAGLIAYWLVDRLQGSVVANWPFDRTLVETIASDLGISLHG